MTLMEPRDYSYEECLADYRRRRSEALADVRKTIVTMGQYRQAAIELHAKNEFDAWRDMEFRERVVTCSINRMMARDTLSALRQWITLVRVAHKKASREDYHLGMIANHLGIDPTILRTGVAQLMSMVSTKH